MRTRAKLVDKTQHIMLYFVNLMQPSNHLRNILEQVATPEHYLFSTEDFYQLFPDMTAANLTMLLSRTVKAGLLQRVCKGIYLYPKVQYDTSLVLYHTAAKVRTGFFSYLSLESILSEHAIISQILPSWITIMTTGRRGQIRCSCGTIEFIHTKQKFESISQELFFNSERRLWQATPRLAFDDIKKTGRSQDLIDREALSEFI